VPFLSPPPRQPSQPKAETTPDPFAVAGGGSTSSSDRLYDVSQRVSSIEKSLTYLEGHAQDASKELKGINEDIVAAKATFQTLKVVFAVVGSICVALWTIVAGTVLMMAKHYLGW
jgi:hypothetical protein